MGLAVAIIVVAVIIAVIIAIQIYFFSNNLKRMKEFSNIFHDSKSWGLVYNDETGFVEGVKGHGNDIFESIVTSINKYLGNNTGSVIDFGLLKDAVDRHCDSVENDIAAQTPIPLYCGLAGTMAGVIVGLLDLLLSGAMGILMDNSVETEEAVGGIEGLLWGVGLAMLASICGIVLTTINSILFKKYKSEEEAGKNSFLAWMQSRLLPELPSDTSDALNKLVKNLNRFNRTFADNTTNLGTALQSVNESYAIQADIIRQVHDMDVMKMAKANVRVLQELKECTDKLEAFNEYLSDIEGYTEAIHRFEAQFAEQADRVHILEEIRDFFNSHKSAISRSTADADQALQEAMSTLKDHTSTNVNEMQRRFVEQSEHFKRILSEEKEAFESYLSRMNTAFGEQISRMPAMGRQLEEISAIPARLDRLIERIDKSNQQMVIQIARAFHDNQQHANKGSQLMITTESEGAFTMANGMPEWVKWTGFGSLVVIALACLFNIIVYFIPRGAV